MLRNPFIYEINTWIWLNELSSKYGTPVRLGSVPAAEWDALASWGFDAIWLMGIWERSPRGIEIAREHPGLQAEYRRALPDYTPDDVVGSPYSIHRYVVDGHLGGPAGLASARNALARRKMALILDFVPNHVSPDHHWTIEHPEYFIHDAEGRIAHGRDPYFPPWTDTAQINVFHPRARLALIQALKYVASQCDAVRCDMAMLLLNDIFRKTWGEAAGTPPQAEFWSAAIPAVRAQFRDFTFIGEVYWNLEWQMQQLGFDYCYDKRLYDRLANENAASVRDHLAADIGYQSKLVRGIENHDEGRAAAVFQPQAKEEAAMVALCTLPGAKLFHEGQFEGRTVKVPVQLGRRPAEPKNVQLYKFSRKLLDMCRDPLIRHGDWERIDSAGANLLAWTRALENKRALIAVNYGDTSFQGHVELPWHDLRAVDVDLAAWEALLLNLS